MALSTANLLARQLKIGQGISAFAGGGRIRPGQVGLVGEQGPELVLGREPATIIPSTQTAGLLGAGQGVGAAAPAPTAPRVSPMPTGTPSASQALVSQFANRNNPAAQALPTTASRFAESGGVLPGGLVDQPSQDAYMKQALLSQRQQLTPDQLAAEYAKRGIQLPSQLGGSPTPNLATGTQQQTTGLSQAGGLPPNPFAIGAGNPMGGIDPQLLQALQQGLSGQNAPQAPQAPQFDPALMQLIKDRAMGIGTGPSFEDIIQGTFEPMSALLDQQFETAQTQAFEQLVSRGVLQSGETFNAISQMSRDFGMTKAALVGQLALDYSQQRQQQISDAINQWGVLEGQRASNQTTLTAANIQAATQIMATSMTTLATLNSAMAQIASTERIAGADIASREKIAGMQIGAQKEIAGMDIASRQAIAEMQASVQRDVANISAQAMLQATGFQHDVAMQQLDAKMLMEGIDWDRYNSDPAYHQEIVMEMGMRADTMWAIAQAQAAAGITDPLLNGAV